MSDATRERGILAWFAGNHVASNILMLFVMGAGLLSLLFIRVEIFQDVDPGIVRVHRTTIPNPAKMRRVSRLLLIIHQSETNSAYTCYV